MRVTLLLALACVACQPSAAPTPVDPPAPATPSAAAPLSVATPAEVGAVSLKVLPQFGAITDDVGVLNVLVRLEGTADAPARRPPLDLALVLDRSGSMRGDKIRAMKAAALKLVDTLDEGDRVTLLSYSDDVRTHASRQMLDAEGREHLRQALLGIDASGMTALGPATFRALDLLAGGERDATRAGHVMLLSDGLANVGEKRPEQIAARAAAAFRHGVSVSTLGVGVDYNEDLMTRLADAGGGRYHFIADSAAVARVLDDELGGLVATVARGVELDLKLPEGVILEKAFGYPVRNEDGRAIVRVGALGAKQVREVVLRLRLPEARAKTLALGELSLRFQDVLADGIDRRIDAPLSADRAESPERMRGTERLEVTVRVAEVEAAEQLEVVARAADKGDFAAASNTLKVAIDDLKRKNEARPSPKLAAQIQAFEEAEGEMAQARRSDSGRKAYTKKFKSKAYRSKKR